MYRLHLKETGLENVLTNVKKKQQRVCYRFQPNQPITQSVQQPTTATSGVHALFKLFILLTNLARLLNYFKETEIIMSIFSFTNDKAAKSLLYGGFPLLAIYGYLYLVCCSVWQS